MRLRLPAAAALCALWSVPAWAQGSTAIADYYRCNQATEQQADAIYQEHVAPLYAKQVEAGRLTSHGWARHWLGGEWRRHSWIIGTDVDAMVEAREAVIQELQQNHGEAMQEFYAICSSHDDYVWGEVVSSSVPAQEGVGAGVGATTYFECGSDDAEADAIVTSVFAPVMNARVEEGEIASWTWLRHELGGRYERALVTNVASHRAALAHGRGIAAALGQAAPEMSRRFGEICPSHTDYVWDQSSN